MSFWSAVTIMQNEFNSDGRENLTTGGLSTSTSASDSTKISQTSSTVSMFRGLDGIISDLEDEDDDLQILEVKDSGYGPSISDYFFASESDEDGNIGSHDGDRRLTLPQCIGSDTDDESISDDGWDDVITIDDDDDKPKTGQPKEMICYRCPTKASGTFKDVGKYWMHIKRHVFGEHFVCPTCRRPFITLSFCLSHEIRVHGTEFGYDKRDAVISFAKKYVQKKQLKKQECGGDKSTIGISHNEKYETDETDCEDSKFYADRVVSSSSLYPYRGPQVNNMIESYEIQYYHSRDKPNRSNQVARLALDIHEENINKGQDFNRLGRFSKQKKPVVSKRGGKKTSKKPAKKPDPVQRPPARETLTDADKVKNRAPAKRPRDALTDEDKEKNRAPAKRPRDALTGEEKGKNGKNRAPAKQPRDTLTVEEKGKNRAPAKRPRDALTKEDKVNKPVTKRRRIIQYFTSSSSSSESDDSDDADYVPEKAKKNNSQAAPSTSSKNDCDGPSRRRKTKAGYTMEVRKLFNPIMEHVCLSCNYVWKTDEDLRSHRDSMHPNMRLLDLMAYDVKVKVKKTKGATNPTQPHQTKPNQSKDMQSGSIKSYNFTRLQQRRVTTTHPLPDSSFSKREMFLHCLGLSYTPRLHLHLRKPWQDLKLPKCFVQLERIANINQLKKRSSMN